MALSSFLDSHTRESCLPDHRSDMGSHHRPRRHIPSFILSLIPSSATLCAQKNASSNRSEMHTSQGTQWVGSCVCGLLCGDSILRLRLCDSQCL